MPGPSLHARYRHFDTTTARSARHAPPTSSGACFPLRFYRTAWRSLVPYDSLPVRLANLTPDAVYPVTRYPIHSCHRYNRSYLLSTSPLPLRGFIVGSLAFNSHRHTYGDHCHRFSLSLTTGRFPCPAA